MINKEDVHDIKMYVCISIISLMFFFMTTKEKQSVTPYVLFDKYRQCYPLCFFPMMTDEEQQLYPLYFI